MTALTVTALTAVAAAGTAAAADAADTAQPASVQPVVDLGAAGSFSALTPAALTISGGSAAGAIYSSSVSATVQAQQDLASAYNSVALLTPTATIAGDLGGRTITPGVYHADAALAMSSSVTFDALGDPNAVFIFQVGAAINTAASSRMVLINGAQASHVYWQTAAAVTTGASSYFIGTILGNAAITTGAGTMIEGRALTMGGAVTLAETNLLPVPDISLTASVTPSLDVEAGDSVTFSHVIRNLGNVELTIDLNTGLPSTATTSIAWPGAALKLIAGASVTAFSTYIPTLADAAHRSITSIAGVIGTPLGYPAVSATATVVLAVYPTPVGDTVSATQNTPATFNVLTNDAGAESGATFSRVMLGTNPRLVAGATGSLPQQTINGSITCTDSGIDAGVDRGQCRYQPIAGFVGTDGFDYTLAQETRSWVVHVTIIVSAGPATVIAHDNRVVANAGGPDVVFDPSANSSPASDGIATGSTIVISTSGVPVGQGTLVCSGASCTYTPPLSGYTGTADATFTLAVINAAGVAGLPSAPAKITVFVDPAPLIRTGFVASSTISATVSVGDWTASTVVSSTVTTCVSSRPSTTIGWNTSPGATSWLVQRRHIGATTGEWMTVATVAADTTTYTDSDVGEGVSYQWQVRPDLHAWPGTFSPPSAVTTENPALTAAGC